MLSKLWSRRLMFGGILGALGVFHLLCPLQIGVVSGASMEPTFRSRQVILIDREYYRNHSVKRGDVVIVRQGDTVLIKRVFALGGDSFWTLFNTDDGELYRDIIDPERLPRFRRVMPLLHSYRMSRYHVPDGSIYVVGDNTNASVDSRHFGPVAMSAILGHVQNAPPLPNIPEAIALQHSVEHEGTFPVARASIH